MVSYKGQGEGGGGGGASDVREGGDNLTDRILVAGAGAGPGEKLGGNGGGQTGANGTGGKTAKSCKGLAEAAERKLKVERAALGGCVPRTVIRAVPGALVKVAQAAEARTVFTGPGTEGAAAVAIMAAAAGEVAASAELSHIRALVVVGDRHTLNRVLPA